MPGWRAKNASLMGSVLAAWRLDLQLLLAQFGMQLPKLGLQREAAACGLLAGTLGLSQKVGGPFGLRHAPPGLRRHHV